ncbi:MAG: GldG family protein [Candidatus Sericytochromatia bacterium]|nr:GldG family protein [Candidatus Sericytochromatia bacterium]
MSEQHSTPSEDRLSTIDKVNLAFGLLAILLLAGSLLIGYSSVLASKLVAWFPNAGPQLPGYLRTAGMGAMGVYVLTLLMLKEKEVGAFLKHRRTASGATIAVQIAAVIGILAAANYYGTRHHVRLDITESKQYSLSEQSLKVVKDLKEPITVQVFLRKGDAYAQNLETLWKQYAYASEQVKLEIIDADQNPTLARQNKVTVSGTSIITRAGQTTTITGNQEQDLTSALIKVGRTVQKTIYFTVGHGELAYDKFDKDGISQLKDLLEKQSYKLDQLYLFTKASVPADAALVVVAAPTKPLSQKEIDALDTYIKTGGRAFVSANPQTDTNLNELTKRYGIELRNDLVIDPAANLFGDLAIPVVQKFPYHVITQNLQAAYFPGSRSLQKAKTQPAGVTNITPLVETSEAAWGESDLKAKPLRFDAGKDTKGPVPLMMVSEMGSKGRLIVAGNGYFFANAAFGQLNNGDLFMNALNWLTGEDSLVSIPPKDASNKQVNLVPNQYYAIFFGTVLGFPLALLLTAALVWWRRR